MTSLRLVVSLALWALASLTAGCSPSMSDEEKTRLLQSGDEALLAAQLDEAEGTFARVLSVYPDNARALAGRGLALLRSGREEEALESFQSAVDIAPDDLTYQYLLAQCLLSLDRPDEALAAFDEILVRDPSHTAAAIGMLEVLLGEGRPNDAAEVARAAMRQSPEDYELLIKVARSLEVVGAFAEAYGAYERARRLRPYRTETIIGMISTLRRMNRHRESEQLMPILEELERRAREMERLRREAAASPENAVPARAYVKRLLAEGWLDVAVAEATLFLEQFPDDPEVPGLTVRAAQAAMLIGEQAQAEGLLSLALADMDSLSEEERLGVARLLNVMGRFEQALPLFSRHLETHPEDTAALAGRGRSEVARGNLEAAEGDLRRAVDIDPDSVEAHAALGLLAMKRNDLPAAKESFDTALGLDGDHPDAQFGMGLLAHQQGRLDEAEGYLRRSIARRPSDVSALAVLALVLSDQDRCDEAIPVFREALESDHANLPLHAGIVRCYEKTGRTAEAEAARKNAEEILGVEEEPPVTDP